MGTPTLTVREFTELIEYTARHHGDEWREFCDWYRIPHIPADDDYAAFLKDLALNQNCAPKFYSYWLLKI